MSGRPAGLLAVNLFDVFVVAAAATAVAVQQKRKGKSRRPSRQLWNEEAFPPQPPPPPECNKVTRVAIFVRFVSFHHASSCGRTTATGELLLHQVDREGEQEEKRCQ